MYQRESESESGNGQSDNFVVSFPCVCPVIDHAFRHNIVRVVWVDEAIYFDNVMTKFMINNKTDAWKADVNLLNTWCAAFKQRRSG